MAITQLGLHGPQMAYGTFGAKAADPGGGAGANRSMLPLMGAGGYLLWVLVHGW